MGSERVRSLRGFFCRGRQEGHPGSLFFYIFLEKEASFGSSNNEVY
jgi:hypothetical protein